MIDLEINSRGDLVLDNKKVFSPLRLNFVVSKYPTARICFLQGQSSNKAKVYENNMLIRFHTDSLQGENGKTARSLVTKEALKQQIMIRLRTEHGDISTNRDFGSKIVYAKHKDINSLATQSEIKNAVLEEIGDVLEDPDVIVKAERGEGTFYCQNINVYVFDSGKLLYKFNLLGVK